MINWFITPRMTMSTVLYCTISISSGWWD